MRWDNSVQFFFWNELVRRALGNPLAIRFLRVVSGLLLRGPAEDCHQLFIGCAVLGGDGCTCLPKAVRRTLGQFRLIAPVAHFVSQTIHRERLAELGREEREVAGLALVDR